MPDASFDDYIIVFPADSGLPPIYTIFRDRREEPGIMIGYGQPDTAIWLGAADKGGGVPIPSRVAEVLRGKQARNFKSAREAIWIAVSEDAVLSAQFNKVNLTRMKSGSAPFVPKGESVGGRKVYEIHHHLPISAGGEVYNIDNLRITTPKLHITIHKNPGKKP